MRHDFTWALSELALGAPVRRCWWPRKRYLTRAADGKTLLVVGPLRAQFTASRGDINAEDWVEA